MKGRDTETETLTQNECMSAINARGDYWLALVAVRDSVALGDPAYIANSLATEHVRE